MIKNDDKTVTSRQFKILSIKLNIKNITEGVATHLFFYDLVSTPWVKNSPTESKFMVIFVEVPYILLYKPTPTMGWTIKI